MREIRVTFQQSQIIEAKVKEESIKAGQPILLIKRPERNRIKIITDSDLLESLGF